VSGETQRSRRQIHLGSDRSKRDWIGDGIFYAYDKSWPGAAEMKTYFEVETLTYAGYTELYCGTEQPRRGGVGFTGTRALRGRGAMQTGKGASR
jgi:hypothetical protein